MACHAKEDVHQYMWYSDIRYSNHMYGDKSIFSDLDETFCNTVSFGDKTSVSVLGKGNVKIYMKNNTT